MYKCTDCGKEYKEKPQFCDCGNITFTEITAPKEKKEQKKQTANDIPSIAFFILCIILSILSLIFIGKNDTNKQSGTETKSIQQKTTNKNIPEIDKLWQEKKYVNTSKQNIKPSLTITPNQSKNEKSPIKNIETKTKKNINQTNKPTIKTSPSTSPKTSSNIISQQNKTTQTQAIQNTNTASSPSQNITIQDVKTNLPIIDEKTLQEELKQYKKDLRNRIAKDINFLEVYGDGSCIISFKIDSSGKLINREFTKKSENDSLNDAVFIAMKKNPTYKTPPTAYKNELLKLSVSIYGGNFTVDLK